MIKGHTKIELFNAKTGEREFEYEKDNLVTNAVQELIAFQTMIGRPMNIVLLNVNVVVNTADLS